MFTACTPFSKWREVKNFVVKKSVGEGHKSLIFKEGLCYGGQFFQGGQGIFWEKGKLQITV